MSSPTQSSIPRSCTRPESLTIVAIIGIIVACLRLFASLADLFVLWVNAGPPLKPAALAALWIDMLAGVVVAVALGLGGIDCLRMRRSGRTWMIAGTVLSLLLLGSNLTFAIVRWCGPAPDLDYLRTPIFDPMQPELRMVLFPVALTLIWSVAVLVVLSRRSVRDALNGIVRPAAINPEAFDVWAKRARLLFILGLIVGALCAARGTVDALNIYRVMVNDDAWMARSGLTRDRGDVSMRENVFHGSRSELLSWRIGSASLGFLLFAGSILGLCRTSAARALVLVAAIGIVVVDAAYLTRGWLPWLHGAKQPGASHREYAEGLTPYLSMARDYMKSQIFVIAAFAILVGHSLKRHSASGALHTLPASEPNNSASQFLNLIFVVGVILGILTIVSRIAEVDRIYDGYFHPRWITGRPLSTSERWATGVPASSLVFSLHNAVCGSFWETATLKALAVIAGFGLFGGSLLAISKMRRGRAIVLIAVVALVLLDLYELCRGWIPAQYQRSRNAPYTLQVVAEVLRLISEFYMAQVYAILTLATLIPRRRPKSMAV